MKKILFLLLPFFCCLLASAQGSKPLLTLDNYAIPVGESGAIIGKVISPDNQKVSLSKDASKLFEIDKQGNLKLKKNKQLDDQSPISYEITIKHGKDLKKFELVKDNFARNKVIAHRGAWKKHEVSNNSMSSLKYAIDLGCEGTEIDVWMSKDNVVVLSHDPTIGGKTVEETTAEDLSNISLKNGDFVPTLEETIKEIKKQNKTKLVIEIKGTRVGKPISDSVVSLVHRMKAQGWVDYIAFGMEYLVRVKELDPTAIVAYLGSDKTLEELNEANMDGIDFHQSIFTKDTELVNKAKVLGLTTNVWTVNNEETLKKMLDQGLERITTDEPELLFRILNE
ncbi:MAG: hypothetical protein LBV43_05355 [Prevotella sp.]|nr:hypothetical protein [Prevotella sp.]